MAWHEGTDQRERGRLNPSWSTELRLVGYTARSLYPPINQPTDHRPDNQLTPMRMPTALCAHLQLQYRVLLHNQPSLCHLGRGRGRGEAVLERL